MEKIIMFNNFFKGKKILITGHTGFKGGWLSLWLHYLGSKVYGYSFQAEQDSVYYPFKLENKLDKEQIGDVRDLKKMQDFIKSIQPDIIFHMAAQPLVITSFEDPITTFDINVMGTVNLLESCKKIQNQCAVVIVTTDKVYKNKEWEYSYRESDELGGKDPYSASKSCCELVVNSFISSFYNSGSKWNNIKVATGRAGNVIGGGDWSDNRIVPDCIRSLSEEKEIVIRNRNAVRPWQHVLDPLNGYLILAKKMFLLELENNQVTSNSDSYNFGPSPNESKTVQSLVEEILKNWEGKYIYSRHKQSNQEAQRLTLAIDKSINELDWMPALCFGETIKMTVEWYKFYFDSKKDLEKFTLDQIISFYSKSKLSFA